MALSPSVVDVYLGLLNQTPGDRSGPIGRLKDLIDAQVRHYTTPQLAGEAQRIVAEARDGFSSLTNGIRAAATGALTAGTWDSPELLEPLGDQLLSIASSIPRVFNGSAWSGYQSSRVVSSKLSESVFHTSNHTIQAQTSWWLNGVTCAVWTETSLTPAGEPIGTSYVGFKSDDEAWVRTPTVLYAPNNKDIRVLAKVVSDGENFWVFWNDEASGFRINVGVYNTHGEQLAHITVTQHWQNTPGYWDVYGSASTGVLLAQPASFDPPNEVHVETTTFVYATGTITPTAHTDTTMHCQGPVAFKTNDLNNGLTYLDTIGPGEADGGRLWAYEITNRAQTHVYDTTAEPVNMPDSITGWVVEGTGGIDVYTSFSELAPEQAQGPKFDPACRYTQTWFTPHTTTGSFVRQANSVIQVSRAFQYNALGEYAAYTYYQSGSGLVLTQDPIPVSHTAGDYMFGAAIQPIKVNAGTDFTQGNPVSLVDSLAYITATEQSVVGPFNITNTDTVAISLSSGLAGVPDGTPIATWTFANYTAPTWLVNTGGAIMQISGSSIPTANGSFDVLETAPGGHVFKTYANERISGVVPIAGTFTASTNGVTVQPMIAYTIPSLPGLLPNDVVSFFINGSIVVTCPINPGMGGTFTPSRVVLNEASANSYTLGPAIWVPKTSQTGTPEPWTAVLSPRNPGRWNLGGGSPYDSSYVGANLVVVDSQETANTGTFEITAAGGSSIDTTGADSAGQVGQIFSSPTPSVSVELADPTTAYNFKLQSVTPDYTYVGALVSLVGSAFHTSDDGVYRVTGFDAANNILFTLPTNGKTDQVNQDFSGAETITIFLENGIQPEFQPTWFLTPLTGSQPQVGRFEAGLAFADWRFEGESGYFGPNVYPLSLASVSRDEVGQIVTLPYRAKSFTAGALLQLGGVATNAATTVSESTVGLKSFSLGTAVPPGLATALPGELLLPGPMAASFTASGFHENGINVGPEAPFVVSEENDTSSSVIGLTPKGAYVYQVVFEVTDETGDRVFSIPSPAIDVTMTGDNNTVTIGGRLITPLDSDGSATVDTYGVTCWTVVGMSIYRTAVNAGTPSVQLYKITNDLNINGLYPGSGAGSGFTFPDPFTWNYRDQNADATIVTQEILYTNKGLAPKFPAPAHRQGVGSWEGRSFVCGYDGALWMSGEKTEGDAEWFFPGYRFTFGDDRAVCCASMDQSLIVFGDHSVWYIPATNFPNATNTSGSLPTPIRLPFPMGSTGFCKTIREGVVYSSTTKTGELWLITRDLRNIYFSKPVQDALVYPITGMAVDAQQRLAVTTAISNQLVVYDGVPQAWYRWRLPTEASVLTACGGAFTYQDNGFVLQQVPDAPVDTRDSVVTPIAPDITLSSLSFANVRGLKALWAMQLVGEYRGPHNLNAIISYPDDDPDNPTVFPDPDDGPYQPDPALPYLMEINPMIEEASSYGLRVFASFEGIDSPGLSFALELVSCEVGLDTRSGLNKFPDNRRIAGK